MQTSIRQLSYFATHLLKTLAIISSDVSHKSLEAKTMELVCALRAFEPAFWAQWVVIKTVVGSVNDKIFARRRPRAGFDNGIERLFVCHRSLQLVIEQLANFCLGKWSCWLTNIDQLFAIDCKLRLGQPSEVAKFAQVSIKALATLGVDVESLALR